MENPIILLILKCPTDFSIEIISLFIYKIVHLQKIYNLKYTIKIYKIYIKNC